MRKEELKQYLEIYRSVEGYEDVEEYIKVLERGPTGSFEQVLSAIFEAVIEADIDPGNVDLRKFLKAYYEIVKRNEEIDYFFAGKVILYSWEIILKETRRILKSLLPGPEEEEKEEEIEKTPEVLPVVYHKERRPITLLDLLEAAKRANEALKEERKLKRRRKNVQIIQVPPPEIAHEDLEMEIQEIYEKLKERRGRVGFKEIMKVARDPISAFIALLFLAFEGKILLWKKEGEIFAEIV